MVKLAKRGASLNSLWLIVYCVLVLAVHAFVTYLGIAKYQRLNDDALWGGDTPGELRVYIALIVLAILFIPLFVFTSLLKVGNTANDGTKLGRDHALDCNINTIGARIGNTTLRHLWEQFPPFSPVFHLLSAFLLVIPEVVITAAEVKHGITPTDAVWESDLDFLFDKERVSTSNIIGQSNLTVLANLSFYVVPTPRPPVGGWTHDSNLHASFVYMAAGLFAFSVRYASVFWFTNKIFGILFATQLLFMTIEALFTHCGVSILYKLSANYAHYEENISVILGPGAIMFLYILGGMVLLFSTIFIYNYGANYFQEKFKIIDKRHHPDAYRKQTVIVHGSCQGHKTHTSAMVSLVLLAAFKGPILYDLVSLYRATKDSLILSCIIINVCYMVFWIVLWTALTLKQQWEFRILDYVPLNQPVFMISNENIVKSASYHGGSMDLHDQCQRKRPSSLPSELTASESGFGDVNSSEDERERFELSLPPLAEVPGLINSRKKGSTHSLDRRSRGRRNGNQRVTFHETVKRCTSTDDKLFPGRRHIYVAADVHGRRHPIYSEPTTERSSTPIELEILRGRKAGSRHSIGSGPLESPASRGTTLNNILYKQSPSESDIAGACSARARAISPCEKTKETNNTDKALNYRDLTIKNDYAYCNAKSNLKSSNIQTQTQLNNAEQSTNRPTRLPFINDASVSETTNNRSPVKDTNKQSPNNLKTETMLNHNRLSPRSLDFVDKKHDISLGRRDSANYSLTSSQETASNDSEHTHQALCSQPKPRE